MRKTHITYYLRQINSCILMPFMAILFLLTNTVFNLWINERMETIQNVLAILIVSSVIFILLKNVKLNLVPWIKNNVLVIIYFLVRIASLLNSGFEYSVIRSIFFEAFFLIGICKYILNPLKRRNIYITFFLWFDFIIVSLSILIFILMPYIGKEGQEILITYTYYKESAKASLFSNINTAGILSGFSIIFSMVLYNQNAYNKKVLCFFGVYNTCAMVFFGTRSAYIGVVFTLIFWLIKAIKKSIDCKKLTIASLCLMMACLIPIYGMIGYYESKESLSYEPIEEKVSLVSSFRYSIWKECYIVQQENLLLGEGSLALEQKARADLIDNYEEDEIDIRYFIASDLGPHNGYIGMISGTGWLGFLAFIAILIQRIRRSKSLESGNWYLLLIFFFAINCFESLFILNRFFICFYMFLILESDWEKGDEMYLDNIKTDK